MSAVKMKFSAHIKAAPGWYVLEALPDDNDFQKESLKTPVLAWAFEDKDGLCIPYPVTTCGVNTDSVYFLRPDGIVENPCSGWFPSFDDWLEYQQSECTAKKGRAQ